MISPPRSEYAAAILMFHSLDWQRSPITITPALFEQQLAGLQRSGCQVISLLQWVQAVQTNQKLPPKAVILTFDDGFFDFYSIAFPLLQRYSYPATVFLVTNFCGSDNSWPGQTKTIPVKKLMSWSHIQELSSAGIDFGAHTYTHPYLDRISEAQAADEIIGSKSEIEDRTGRNVIAFAYPYGSFTPLVKSIVNEHFQCACSTQIGFARVTDDIFALPRIEANDVKYDRTIDRLFSAEAAIYLSVRKMIRQGRSKIFQTNGY